MLENMKSGCTGLNVEQDMRRQLHDISNVLTVLVGKAEILSKNNHLSEKEKAELQSIVEMGFACFKILEKSKDILRNKAA